ncbi:MULTISPECIES: 6-phosphogluconolactonase [Rhizobium]|uniref:6-phosphogluconolactonase n=1 Tax=Rhizobium rhododendri TaxID=2506430 RepID=A0ABY8IJ47_9HYPH|nr:MULTISPECIES: 6-phosphogluconolactonase [Rhizobium]MBZ5760426.1 6-phosphogluconolactonase [Rhizobium sp. VS19-DR96]MBZ5766730.1 6-phosphogluconolactonase [Rhizobium sp. VS19-DR129.2]MBZ5773277.1 6-phosphogluconolactonase [Rhizobium sp. VS19-DRK62.2]MBZ5784261.1 6-phosphogluconolactonase [Rhizobium sp. VS19-DR121]MBZ5802621.1 6-phosphogluconolactonase [Rhizobium sp. VS19-DR181]
MTANMHAFESGPALATGLANKVAETLSAAVAARGTASIAVSGGSTPKAFFEALSLRAIDWSKVTITLVDERFVPADNPRSNHLLVKQHLLKNNAAAAKFLPLYQPAADAEKSAVIATAETRGIDDPFDIAILGMGGDGHTASFFPGGSNLAKALDPQTPRGIITMEAEGAGEPRLTFTFASLQDARLLVLHIEGQSKKDVLAKAEAAGEETEMPIRAILRRAASPVEIYWAP